jgi:TonB family protein
VTASCIDSDEAPGSLRVPLAYSLATHVFLLCLILIVQNVNPTAFAHDPSEERALGYWDKLRRAGDLDLRQMNAVRFRIFQPPGGKAGGAPQRAALPADATGKRVAKQTGARLQQSAPPAADGALPAAHEPRLARDVREAASPGDAGVVQQALQPDVALSDDLAIVELVKPAYPEHELQAGISARIVAALHVNGHGEIDDVQILEATTSPPASTRAFELTALEALKRWRIRLPTGEQYRDGCWLRVPIEYNPEDEQFDNLDDDLPTLRMPPPDS